MRPRFGRVRNVGFASLGGLLVGIVYATGMLDDDPFGGVAIALAGGALLLFPAVVGIGRRRGPVSLVARRVGGGRHRGVVFRVRWSYRIALPLMFAAFGVDPALLFLALRYYLEHPDDRPELGTREAVERIRAGRLLGQDDQVVPVRRS